MEVSRREFIKNTCLVTTGTLLPSIPLSVFSRTVWADPPARIEPKAKHEIECAFAYIHNDKVSLVVDIIRHYKKMLFRGFMVVADGQSGRQWYDFCRLEKLFPFNPGKHLWCEDGEEIAYMKLNSNHVHGENLHIRDTSNPSAAKVSFELTYKIMAEPFRSSDFFDLGSDSPFQKLIDGFSVKAVSLLHEDFLSQKLSNSKVSLTDDSGSPITRFFLDDAKCAIAHHWGWAFPNYIFLMCNDFNTPDTILTLCCNEVMTRAATDLKVGYLYMKPGEGEKKKIVSPTEGKALHFVEDNKLSVIAYNKKNGVRVDIDYKNATKSFPNFFNTHCVTYLSVPCEVTDLDTGKSLCKSTGAVLDIKGFTLP